MDKQNNQKHIKAFEELTITDDFMFGAVFSDMELCKEFLEKLLNIKIRKIMVPERQKTMKYTYISKGIRLDIYVEDDNNTVYNIEMQTTDKGNLSLRIRYYHSMIDLNIIDKGEDFSHLKKSFVIFICTFDPFGRDRYVYTFENRCKEEPDIFLNDNAFTIILNCNGHKGEISEEMKGLLHYMAGQPPQGRLAEDIAEGVEKVHKNEKWRDDYMTLNLKIMEERQEARQEGRQEGQKIGDLSRVISTIRALCSVLPSDKLAASLKISNEEYNAIIEMISSNPDWTDEEIAEDILGYSE